MASYEAPLYDFYGVRRDVQIALAMWGSLSPGNDQIVLSQFGITEVNKAQLSALTPLQVEGFINACVRLLESITASPSRLAALKRAHLAGLLND